MPVEEFTLAKFIKLATRPEKDRPIHTMSFDSIPDSYIEFFSGRKVSVQQFAMPRPISCHWFLIIPPENIKKSCGFLMFSGSIERDHRH